MASANRAQDDLHVGSISSTNRKKHHGLGLSRAEDARRGTVHPVPLPFSPSRISSLSGENSYGHPQFLFDAAAGNFYGHPQNLSNAAMHNMNMNADAGNFNNHPLEPTSGQNTMADYTVPFLGYGGPSFPSIGATVTTNSAWQSNMMGSNNVMNGPNRDRNLIDHNSNGARNFHMVGSDEEQLNNTWRLANTNRSLSTLCTVPEIPHAPDFVGRAYNNLLSVNAPQLDHLNKLDGRFLSLGYQSKSVFDGQAGAYCRTSFSNIDRLADDSLNKLSVPLFGFGENVGGFTTQGYSSNVNLSSNDNSVLQAVNSGFDGRATPALPGGKINLQDLIPTSSTKSSGSKNEIDLKLSPVDTFQGRGANPEIVSNVSVSNLFPETMQRMMHTISFDSSVLRSNHQNAFDQMQNSHLSTNMKLPPSGETNRQYQSGQVYPTNVASNAGADEGFQMFHSGVPKSASQVYPLNVKQDLNSLAYTGQGAVSGLNHLSSSLGRKSRKRSLPPVLRTPEQLNGSDSAGAIKAFSAVARTLVHPSDSVQALISPTQIPAAYSDSEDTSSGFCTSVMNNPAASANIPVIACEASSAFTRTTADHTRLPRVPFSASPPKVVLQTPPPALHIPSPAIVSRKKSFRATSPDVSSLGKRLSALAALAKVSPAYRTAQFPASATHIKWQGLGSPRPIGEKCLLCERDLSYNPEGSVSIPSSAPAVAVLPCAHTFHDNCLSRITPADQSKDPPCIPCAIGKK